MEKNKEEIKERLIKANALSDEELEKVNGGVNGVTCSYCTICGALLGRWIWFGCEDKSMYNDYVYCSCGWKGTVEYTHKRIELF